MIFRTAYFNSKTKTIINESEIIASIQTSRDIKWHRSLVIRGFGMDCRINQ